MLCSSQPSATPLKVLTYLSSPRGQLLCLPHKCWHAPFDIYFHCCIFMALTIYSSHFPNTCSGSMKESSSLSVLVQQRHQVGMGQEVLRDSHCLCFLIIWKQLRYFVLHVGKFLLTDVFRLTVKVLSGSAVSQEDNLVCSVEDCENLFCHLLSPYPFVNINNK